MILTANDPGPWQYFVHRRDNIGLPIEVVRDKYLTEQLIFAEQYNQFIAYQNWLMVQGAGEPSLASTLESEIITESGIALITEAGTYIVA